MKPASPGDWLEDEARGFATAGVHVVVSLLEDDEIADLALEHERDACETAGLVFKRFPIRDRDVPAANAALHAFIDELRVALINNQSCAIHCRMGIGRSSLMAAATLVTLGIPAELALTRLVAARGRDVPDTDEQRRWILNFSPHFAASENTNPSN